MIYSEPHLLSCGVTNTIRNLRLLLSNKSENRLNNLIDNLVKILLLDASKPTGHIAFNITRNDLAFDNTRLREGESCNHISSVSG